jgi:uncharacterized protein with FMN-binding domain
MMKQTAVFVLICAILLIAGCAQSAPAVPSAESTPSAAAAPETQAAPPANQILIERNPGPGPYSGEAAGYYGGPVTVTLDVKDRVLTMVDVTGPEETAGIGSRAIDTLGGIMLKANAIPVDVVSGATYSSEAVFLAARKALAKAGLAAEDLKQK